MNVGNVLFLQGDLDGAKAAYLAATDRAAGDVVVLAAAHYDLSKLYLRTSRHAPRARRRARRRSTRRASSCAATAPTTTSPPTAISSTSRCRTTRSARSPRRTGRAQAVQAWVQGRLAGALPRALWPWGPIGWLAVLWALTLAAPRLRTARACERCGGAACRRCDGAAGELCGQCVNVFLHKGLVEARDRLRKEAQVRRHRQFVSVATRILSIVAGGAGQVFHGAPARGALLLLATLFAAFMVWFWRGIMPPPQPSPYVFLGKLLLTAPLGLALWAFAMRDAFRRTQ